MLFGILVAEHKKPPFWLVSGIESRLMDFLEKRADPGKRPPSDSTVATALLQLDVRRIHVPTDSHIINGSLTAVGKNMLLMSGSGQVFHYASGADSVTRSALSLPSNHLADYQAIILTPKYAGYVQDSNTILRYLHLLHVESGGKHLLFSSYTEWHPDRECYTNTIARLDISQQGTDASHWSASPADWQVIFRTHPCLPLKRKMRAIEAHLSGGRMAFDATNRKLMFTVGDFHWDGVFNDISLSQDDANDYGKILAIDLDGGRPQHIAKGLRNAQGITFDDMGRLWATEHGPQGGDELNVITPGSNYGWPLATLGKGYNGLPWKPARQYGRHDDFVPPIYSWIPSVGLSSIIQISGFDAAWNGDFLVGSMAGAALFRVRIAGDHVLYAEPIPIGERIRYILQPEDGVIALWTDSLNLIIIRPGVADDSGLYVERFIDRQEWTDARKDAVRTAISACTQCHTWRPTPGSHAPHLVGIYNRPVAGTQFPGYSDALQKIGGRWTEDRLTRYLADTQAVVPGSTMPRLGLAPQTAQDVTWVLKGLDAAD